MFDVRSASDQLDQRPPIVELDPGSDFALIHLFAVACWPRDKRRRGEALVTWAAQFLACVDLGGFNADGMETILKTYSERAAQQLGVSVEELLSMPQAIEAAAIVRGLPMTLNAMIMSQMFVPGGGWASLANAAYQGQVGDRIKKANQSGIVAGLIVLYCATIQQFHPEMTASYNRAGHIIQFLHEQRRIAVGGDRERKSAWTQWRGVGHIWAAILLGIAVNERIPGGHPSGLAVDVSTLLGWAAWFRDFATTHKAVGAASPLVSSHEAVVLRCVTDAIKPPLVALDEDIRRVALGYRAPYPAQ